jgi:hypothetical protein
MAESILLGETAIGAPKAMADSNRRLPQTCSTMRPPILKRIALLGIENVEREALPRHLLAACEAAHAAPKAINGRHEGFNPGGKDRPVPQLFSWAGGFVVKAFGKMRRPVEQGALGLCQ